MERNSHYMTIIIKKNYYPVLRICTLVFMTSPHKQLIDAICDEVLPNMVRIYESKKMNGALDQDQFVRILEEKIERANKSLKVLAVEEQQDYREKIDKAYAENIDRLRKETSTLQTAHSQRTNFF